jgi:hypothetical protein
MRLKWTTIPALFDRSYIVNQASEESKNPDKNSEKPTKVPFLSVVLSVIQASFGVQNPRNRERDFKSSSIMPFVVAAVLFTVVFILTLVMVVSLVLPD